MNYVSLRIYYYQTEEISEEDSRPLDGPELIIIIIVLTYYKWW